MSDKLTSKSISLVLAAKVGRSSEQFIATGKDGGALCFLVSLLAYIPKVSNTAHFIRHTVPRNNVFLLFALNVQRPSGLQVMFSLSLELAAWRGRLEGVAFWLWKTRYT